MYISPNDEGAAMHRTVAIEGPDGAGKSTQHTAVARALGERGLEVVTVREPGGTKAGEAIRKAVFKDTRDRARHPHRGVADVRGEADVGDRGRRSGAEGREVGGPRPIGRCRALRTKARRAGSAPTPSASSRRGADSRPRSRS